MTQNIINEKKKTNLIENNEFNSTMLKEPFPYPKIYNKGASENHNKKPRLLKESEF